MVDTIFTKIINGEIPSHKVYEDDLTYAFLDIHPKQPGHVLIIPKMEVDHIWDLPDTEYLAVMETSKKVAQRIREVMKPSRVGMQVEGTGVPHAHVHVFPFNAIREFEKVRTKEELSAEPDHDSLAEIAKKLAF